ncbi:hypothetical protein GGS24DRAFT_137694 [Hypoxylon argillaceum]|nr:hypothetical protein GGS24DRAFT_137694 [Hypoxylon argillaceum]
MYSRDEICSKIQQFYRQIIRLPYLNDDDGTLIIPPPEGWSSINTTAGKTEIAVDLLRHLPYLRPNPTNPFPAGHLLIYPGTVQICYLDSDSEYQEDLYPLPAHCVYLARRADYLGRDLILDTRSGAVTEFASDNITVPYDAYEKLPEAERWRAHRTLPLVELLDGWIRMYEELEWMVVPNPIARPELGRFYHRAENPGLDDVDFEGGIELYREQGKVIREQREHAARVYEVYIRHGWPGCFDKERCRAELLELERAKDALERRLMDEMNPDAELFD